MQDAGWSKLVHCVQLPAERAGLVRNLPPSAWTGSFGDGTPNFLRLTNPGDQASLHRRFTLIAAYQTIRPKAEVPAEIVDCASHAEVHCALREISAWHE